MIIPISIQEVVMQYFLICYFYTSTIIPVQFHKRVAPKLCLGQTNIKLAMFTRRQHDDRSTWDPQEADII